MRDVAVPATWLLARLDRLNPDAWQTERWLGVHIPGLGAILTIVIVLLTGLFATNFFGAQLVEIWHEILHRIPVVNSIYSSVKQISDTLFSSSGQAFRKALLVQWPRENMWTIAFLTGTPGPGVREDAPATDDTKRPVGANPPDVLKRSFSRSRGRWPPDSSTPCSGRALSSRCRSLGWSLTP